MTRIFHRLFYLDGFHVQAVTSVWCLLFRPKTVNCSTKNAYTSEITFLANTLILTNYALKTPLHFYLYYDLYLYK